MFSLVNAIASADSILNYGAVGDGVTDNKDALEACFAANVASGKYIYVPEGLFVYSGVKTIQNTVLFGLGNDRSVLKALDPEHSTIYVKGNNCGVGNLTHNASGVTRSSQPDATSIYFKDATNFSAKNVHSIASSGTGIRAYGVTSGVISNNYIEGSLADGIHSTNGSSNILIEHNKIYGAGDDGISVVTYGTEQVTNDITARFNDIRNPTYGRGITVVGGENIKYCNNYIDMNGLTTAGLYIASESFYHTRGVSAILAIGNVILNAGSINTGQGAICICNQGGYGKQYVHSILCDNTSIYNPDYYGITVTGGQSVSAKIRNTKIYSGDGRAATLVSNTSGHNDIREENNVKYPLDSYAAINPAIGAGIDPTFVTS